MVPIEVAVGGALIGASVLSSGFAARLTRLAVAVFGAVTGASVLSGGVGILP